MEDFRDNENGCSGVVFSTKKQQWICGDSLSTLTNFNLDTRTPESEDLKGINGAAITAIAISPDESKIAFATGEKVILRDYPNYDELDNELILCRRTLPITQLQFNANGSHL
jgi:hypothetical protein